MEGMLLLRKQFPAGDRQFCHKIEHFLPWWRIRLCFVVFNPRELLG
jgi:hypothetical protein